jgi:hypothetical protein
MVLKISHMFNKLLSKKFVYNEHVNTSAESNYHTESALRQ